MLKDDEKGHYNNMGKCVQRSGVQKGEFGVAGVVVMNSDVFSMQIKVILTRAASWLFVSGPRELVFSGGTVFPRKPRTLGVDMLEGEPFLFCICWWVELHLYIVSLHRFLYFYTIHCTHLKYVII